MADTVEEKIFRALMERVETIPLPTGWVRATQVALPGIPFTPATNKPFLSVEVHYNRSIETDLSLQFDPIRQGFMRINVMWPKGQGMVSAYALAGKVRDYFRRGTRVTYEANRTDINEDPEIGVAVTGDTHVTVPITIRWTNAPQVPA
jgi:hypothetical protein